MNKEKVIEIIEYAQQNNITEKEACKFFGIKSNNLYYYKKKFDLISCSRGKSPNSKGKRKHIINDNFFSTPNLLNCYYAGFIAADGNIRKDSNSISIGLSSKDELWLKQFLKDLESDYTVRQIMMKEKFNTSFIDISSNQIVNDLHLNFNIVPCKSLILQSPNINENELIDAFIIGYIDGDGCISYSKEKNELQISIVGTKEMLSWIKERFEIILNDSIGNLYHKGNKNTYSLNISNKKARTIFNHYYDINVPKLERKWSTEKSEHSKDFKKKRNIERYKEIYQMLEIDKLTQKEVADKLGVTQAAISWYTKQELYEKLYGLICLKE